MKDEKEELTEQPKRGGFREGAGRKPLKSKDRKSVRRLYRFTKDDVKLISHAVDLTNKHNDEQTTEAEFVRGAVIERATKTITKYPK